MEVRLPWLQSEAVARVALASTTDDSSFIMSLKIFTSKGMLVHLSGSMENTQKSKKQSMVNYSMWKQKKYMILLN